MPSRSQRNEPWLIQRVVKASGEGRGGIDSYFGFDYMGAAEFEYGALPSALKAMRASLALYLEEPKRIKDVNGRVIWYVGPDDEKTLDYVRRFFEDQSYADNRSMSFKERTGMHGVYENDVNDAFSRQIIGWWAIDVEFPWILFTKKEHALAWMRLMRKGAP